MGFAIDEDFAFFLEEFGQPDFKKRVPEELIESFQGKLPNRLLEYWREYGFCRFKGGLFWIVNPNDYRATMQAWLDGTGILEEDSYEVIARSGFGDLFLWGKNTGHRYIIRMRKGEIYLHKNADEENIRHGKADFVLQIFFGTTSPKSLDMTDFEINQRIFSSAINKFGELNEDEVFGFEPALFLGGQRRLAYVNKLNFFIHAEILRSLCEPQMMDIKGLTKKAFG